MDFIVGWRVVLGRAGPLMLLIAAILAPTDPALARYKQRH